MIPASEAASQHRRPSLRDVVVRYQVALYFALYSYGAFVSYLPVAPWSSTTVPTSGVTLSYPGNDSTVIAWFLQIFSYNVTHGLNPLFTDRLNLPFGLHLANVTAVPLLAFLSLPITATWGAFASLNLLVRLSFLLTAWSMYWVIRHWTRPAVAFVAGAIVGFGPFVVSQSTLHLNLAFQALVPLICYAAYRLFVLREGPPWRPGLYLGLACAGEYLISPEILALTVVVLALALAGYAVAAWRELRASISYLWRALVVVVSSFLLVTGYWLYLFLFATGHYTGNIGPFQGFRSDTLGALLPTGNVLLTSAHLSAMTSLFVGGNYTENSQYLGLPLIAAVVYFALRFRRNRLLVSLGSIGALSYLLSMGDRLTVDGHSFALPLPETLLAKLPLLSATVPARYASLTIVFFAAAFALGVEAFLASPRTALAAKNAKLRITALVLLVLAVLLPAFPLASFSVSPPAGVRAAIAAIPNGTRLLTYPYPTSYATETMNWQIEANMKFALPTGYYSPAYPPKLSPLWVQEGFMEAQLSAELWKPILRLPKHPERLLRQYVRSYHIGAILIDKVGLNPEAIESLVTSAYGAPTHRFGPDVDEWIFPKAAQ